MSEGKCTEDWAWWCRDCEGYKPWHTRPRSGDRFCTECGTTCVLVPDTRPLREQLSAAIARASELENASAHDREMLSMLHEQVAQMCEHLGDKRDEVPCDSWRLRDLLIGLKSRAEKAEAEAQETLALLGRGIQLMDGEDELRALVAQQSTELAALKLEVEAWRALAEWISGTGDPVDFSDGCDGLHWYADVTGLRWTEQGRGESVQAAALDLARKLNLVTTPTPDGDGKGE